MDERKGSESNRTKHVTTVERKSERELAVTRTFNGPAHIVFDAWTKPELLKRWWAPKSFGLSFLSCEADVRTGGTHRFVFSHTSSEQPMAFFGRYVEVTPHSRLVWTNDEGDEGGAITTVTFEERGGETFVVVHDLYPSEKALDDATPPEAPVGQASSSSSWTSFSPARERAWDGREVIDPGAGCPAVSGQPTSFWVAANAAIRYAFGHLGAKAVSIGYFDGNEPSGRIVEKLGFRKLGVARQAATRCLGGAKLDRHEYILMSPDALPELDVSWG